MGEHTISIKNLNVYYRTAGDKNNPPVVLLNGWGARVSGLVLSSEKVILELASQGFYVYCPEHPGLMRSETPKGIWGQDDYAQYIKEFIEKLGIQKPILLGQSFGGAIATAYAAKYPEAIKMLILVNAGLTQDLSYHFVFRHFLLMNYFLRFLRSNLVPKDLKKYLLQLTLGIPKGFVDGESVEARSIMGSIFKSWSLENQYKNITAPTLLIWGTNDLLFPLSSAKKVAEQVPHAKLITVFGGHNVLYFQTKKIARIIARNLARAK